MINLGTVFSGIGAIEQALIRLNMEHRIVFGCDNGDVELKLLPQEAQKEYEELKRRSKKKHFPLDEAARLKELEVAESAMIESIRATVFSLATKDAKREFVEALYRDHSRQTNYVQKSYYANYEIDPRDFHQDIRFLDGSDYRGAVDLLVGGSPCQSFSSVGAQLGFEDTRGTLFYEFARIVKEVQPKVFIYENVNGLLTNDNGKTLSTIKHIFRDELHYQVPDEQVLNAADYGIPQTRRRVFIVGFRSDQHCVEGFRYPNPIERRYTLQDFLEENCAVGHFTYDRDTGELIVGNVRGVPDPKFTLTPGVQKYVLKEGTKGFKTSVETDLQIARTLLKTMTQHHRAGVDNYITVNEDPKILRALTDRECLRLMGYPDSFRIVVSHTQIYRQAGNSIVVDVMMALLRQIVDTNIFNNI